MNTASVGGPWHSQGMLQWPNSLARWRLAWLALPWLLAGCAQDSQLGYYWQGLRGHLALMQAARPLPAWIADALDGLPRHPDLVDLRLAST